MRKALTHANLYPDGNAFYLKQKLAAKLGVTPANLILGNGSNEIIEFIGHALLSPGRGSRGVAILLCRLSHRHRACSARNSSPCRPRNYGHDLDAMLAAITPQTRVVFVANPNNPTGTLASPRRAAPIRERRAGRMSWSRWTKPTSSFWTTRWTCCPKSAAGVRPNLLLMRTFSKIYGLAGLRLGYGIGHPDLIAALEKIRQPFNINALSPGRRARRRWTTPSTSRRRGATMPAACEFFARTFRRLKLEFIPSAANFILVRVGDGQRVFTEMQKLGVIVRPMGGYQLPEWIRISDRHPEGEPAVRCGPRTDAQLPVKTCG